MELEFPLVLKKLEVMTDDEFFSFCRANDPLELERDKNGNIIIVSPTGSKTGNVNLILASRVFLWSEETNAGYAFDSSSGFKLPNGATRSPDVAWIKKDRWEAIPEEQQEKFAPICPDFIIELRSVSDDLGAHQGLPQGARHPPRRALIARPAGRITPRRTPLTIPYI